MNKAKKARWGFESLHPHDKTPLPERISRKTIAFGDTMGTQYRPAKVCLSGSKWFVEFWYRIPPELQPMYNNKKWKRFKKYGEINRVRTPEFAEDLRKRWQYALESGYNPFKDLSDRWERIVNQDKPETIKDAIERFKAKWSERGLKQRSLDKNIRVADRLLDYVTASGQEETPIETIDPPFLETYLAEMSRVNEWSNRTYNNELTYLGTMFLFLKNKLKIIDSLPTDGIDRKQVKHTKHRYYNEQLFKKLQDVLKEHDPYLYFACQVVYYLCIRSEEELMNFKVSGIDAERKQVFLSDGKTGERFIPMADEMLKIFKQRGILKANPNHHVFSVPHKNKFVPDGKPGPEPFGPNFFAKRFRKLRPKIGIGEEYTIYGLKHTRIIHLKTDGVDDATIMSLTGHRDYAAYSVYLRDLGLTVNPETINAKTRKF